MISKAKKDYLCDKIVNCGSSRELFRLSSQMMGKFGDAMLPSNISPESLPDKFNEFFVHKFDEIRRSFDPDRPIPTNPVEFSGTAFAEFQLSISGLQLGRAEVLRGLRNFLSTDKPEHHSTDRLKERGVEKESGRHSTLQGRERSVFNQTNIGTVLRATLGRLLRDGAERVWAFPSATMPS